MDDSSSESSFNGGSSPSEVDRFEDVFMHHIAEIEQVWKQLNLARAASAKISSRKSDPKKRKLKYPIKLSAVQNLANRELDDMRRFEDDVADGVEKEAGVLLSFMGAMFIENLMIKTMYHLPQNKSFGIESDVDLLESEKSKEKFFFSLSPNADTGEEPKGAKLDTSNLTDPTSRVRPIRDLIISREDVRRALLREEQFDFLVQSGMAQPDASSSLLQQGTSENAREDSESGDRIHLGYWKILERTFSALEKSQLASTSSSSSSASSSSSSHNVCLKTFDHKPENLTSKVLMSLTPETDDSHRRFTIFPDNEDLDLNSIEFILTKNKQIQGDQAYTKAEISGKIKIGHISILELHGKDIDVSPHQDDSKRDEENIHHNANGPMNFSWSIQNELDENFPLAGRPTPAIGRGSVQLFDPHTAYMNFGSKWLSECTWGVLSLDLIFELGDSGFALHNHYLAIPIFVKIPESLMQ